LKKYPKLDLKEDGKRQFWGEETSAPLGNQNVKHIIGKLSKVYTTYINFDLVPGWGIYFFRKCPSPYKVLGKFLVS